uniref:DNA-directed RNA polymerase subunit n=1 Tax=Bryopsis hypnoides TaxID=222885 RepID=D0EVW4_BRYHP|nr:RNA polymerase beta' subunit [Bryopsis hypnoides]ACX33776.1 RNA polymerase beta' subunit [Bryopsis hypnoides]
MLFNCLQKSFLIAEYHLNYFCLDKQFCFSTHNQCFLFSIFIRNFLFKKDKVNPSYENKKPEVRNSLKFLKITGSYPIFLLLKTLAEKCLNSKYLSIFLLERQIRILLIENNVNSHFFEKIRLLQRLKIIRCFRQTKNKPAWMILSILPVLPPDLRPILQLNNDQIAISDLNKLYQKVLFRNRRLQRLLNDLYIQNVDEMQYAQRLLQESVDALIENGKSGNQPAQTSNNRPLKSLSDMLKGKKGRFRQNLLGKRVDYSGRSVIIVGSNLQLYECGLPKEMAIELFQPFLLRRLIIRKKAKTILGAKKLIQQSNAIIWPILKEVLQSHPILLNRAPTLHRLSIQAFQPKLIEGRAILLHPLVCSSFNADFDGDQMAVHIPLSFESRAEAWKLLWSLNNFISPATGQPILLPSQDMVLGSSYLTLKNSKTFQEIYYQLNTQKSFDRNLILKIQQLSFYEIKQIFNKTQVETIQHYHQSFWIIWNQHFETDCKTQKLLEMKLNRFGVFQKIYPNLQKSFSSKNKQQNQKILTTIGRILFYFWLNPASFKKLNAAEYYFMLLEKQSRKAHMDYFFDRCFEKKRLKQLLIWFYHIEGEKNTLKLLENLKQLGFFYSTKSGLSIGLEDLQLNLKKSQLYNLSEFEIQQIELHYQKSNLTKLEYFHQLVEIWAKTNEKLKYQIINNFQLKNQLNPLFLMAFSGARGNISQVRQLVGMRGLMSDPTGQILDFPIRSNFREGLTLTEYIISCYGARKGIVDTALRTATSGYLTRRLVDVAQHVIIEKQDCKNFYPIWVGNLLSGKKILLSLKQRLLGRILGKQIEIQQSKNIFFKNSEITVLMAAHLASEFNKIPIRSPLTCISPKSICQYCYGWNLAMESIVSLGEAVGVLAAQSIGEPGTQLTMRTFHTGGVFSGDLIEQMYSPNHG